MFEIICLHTWMHFFCSSVRRWVLMPRGPKSPANISKPISDSSAVTNWTTFKMNKESTFRMNKLKISSSSNQLRNSKNIFTTAAASTAQITKICFILSIVIKVSWFFFTNILVQLYFGWQIATKYLDCGLAREFIPNFDGDICSYLWNQPKLISPTIKQVITNQSPIKNCHIM